MRSSTFEQEWRRVVRITTPERLANLAVAPLDNPSAARIVAAEVGRRWSVLVERMAG